MIAFFLMFLEFIKGFLRSRNKGCTRKLNGWCLFYQHVFELIERKADNRPSFFAEWANHRKERNQDNWKFKFRLSQSRNLKLSSMIHTSNLSLIILYNYFLIEVVLYTICCQFLFGNIVVMCKWRMLWKKIVDCSNPGSIIGLEKLFSPYIFPKKLRAPEQFVTVVQTHRRIEISTLGYTVLYLYFCINFNNDNIFSR